MLVATLHPGVASGRFHDGIGDEARYLRHCVVVEAQAHESFDGVQGAFRVGDGLASGDLAHQTFVVRSEGDHRRSCSRAFLVRDDQRFAVLHDCDTGIRGSQVDANDCRHVHSLNEIKANVLRLAQGIMKALPA